MTIIPRFFSLKVGLGAFFLLLAFWMIPDSMIYSQSTSSSPAATGKTTLPSFKTPLPAKPNAPKPTTPTQPSASTSLLSDERPSVVTQTVAIALMSMSPFIIMLLTSFLKIVIVLSLLRTALGVQNAPPNAIINGVGFLLSLFIMYPTGVKMYDAAKTSLDRVEAPSSLTSPDSSAYLIDVAKAAADPLRAFLKRNSSPKHQAIFFKLVYRNLPEEYREKLKPDDLLVIVPSYITGQLKDAFEIGVLIYLPFFVIDLVTSNILLAMGMMMLSPVTISMPLKLFLLVMLDGWTILIEGLVKSFQ